jgi:hypothetical protein
VLYNITIRDRKELGMTGDKKEVTLLDIYHQVETLRKNTDKHTRGSWRKANASAGLAVFFFGLGLLVRDLCSDALRWYGVALVILAILWIAFWFAKDRSDAG